VGHWLDNFSNFLAGQGRPRLLQLLKNQLDPAKACLSRLGLTHSDPVRAFSR
jgi:hypothetical protein